MAISKKKPDNFKSQHLFERYLLRRSRSTSVVVGCDIELFFQNKTSEAHRSWPAGKEKIAIFDKYDQETKTLLAGLPATQKTVLIRECAQLDHNVLQTLPLAEYDLCVMIQQDIADASHLLFSSIRYFNGKITAWDPLKWGRYLEQHQLSDFKNAREILENFARKFDQKKNIRQQIFASLTQLQGLAAKNTGSTELTLGCDGTRFCMKIEFNTAEISQITAVIDKLHCQAAVVIHRKPQVHELHLVFDMLTQSSRNRPCMVLIYTPGNQATNKTDSIRKAV